MRHLLCSFGFGLLLSFSQDVFASSTNLKSNKWLTPPQQDLTLFVSGRSHQGTVVNSSGGDLVLQPHDIIRLRGEVRDQHGDLVEIVPLRLHDSYFSDFDVEINYLNELEIKTKRPTYYPTPITVDAYVGYATHWLQLSVEVAK